jgi:hypothetical protein
MGPSGPMATNPYMSAGRDHGLGSVGVGDFHIFPAVIPAYRYQGMPPVAGGSCSRPLSPVSRAAADHQAVAVHLGEALDPTGLLSLDMLSCTQFTHFRPLRGKCCLGIDLLMHEDC